MRREFTRLKLASSNLREEAPDFQKVATAVVGWQLTWGKTAGCVAFRQTAECNQDGLREPTVS